MKFLIVIIWIIISFLYYTFSQSISFQSLDGPNGGNVGDIALSSRGDIFVSVYYNAGANGVYMSTDNGISWDRMPTDNFSWWIDFFGLGINSEDHLFLGTNGAGIYRSTDYGLSWSSINNGFTSSEGWVFAFDNNANTYVGDGDHAGLYKSTNNGDSWTFLKRLQTLSLTIDCSNSVYVGTWDSLYKSTDYGLTWTTLSNGLPSAPVSSILIKNCTEIFLGTGYLWNGHGVYYSDNGGDSWIQRGLNDQVVYSLVMDTSGIIFAGTMKNGVYRSSDNGKTWELLNNGLINKNIYRLKINHQNVLIAASETDGGIFRSTDLGNTWQNVGLPIGTVKTALISSDNKLFVSTYGGMQKFNNDDSWTNLGPPLLSDIVIDEENILYAGTYRNGIFKSTNFGTSWDSTTSYGGTEYVLLCMAKNSDGSILVGTNDYIKRTTDKGTSWQTISNGLGFWISSLSITPEGIIYAASNNKLFKSNSIDSMFLQIRDSVETDYKYSVLASGVNGNVYYVQEGNNAGVYHSTNYGDNWLKISDSSACSISAFGDFICIGLSSFGILLSSDQGKNWEKVTAGLSLNGNVNYSFFDSSGYLYCSVSNGGLYKTISPLTSINDIQNLKVFNWNLFQNYPNPFNPSTKIRFTIPTSPLNPSPYQGEGNRERLVTLKVYDVLGNLIATLVDEYKPAGSYEVEFQSSVGSRQLASGIYYYQLRVGAPESSSVQDFVQTKKMILLK